MRILKILSTIILFCLWQFQLLLKAGHQHQVVQVVAGGAGAAGSTAAASGAAAGAAAAVGTTVAVAAAAVAAVVVALQVLVYDFFLNKLKIIFKKGS